jgi:uncharacterized membrane protein YfcA
MDRLILLPIAGIVAGAMNALAGGGSFVTLPALIASGIPSVIANATSSVALYPGGAASVLVYRSGLRPVCGVPIMPMLAVTLLGGAGGGLLLLSTPNALFVRALPWLLLLATLALAFGARVGALLHAERRSGGWMILTVQFLLGVYGGFFGGAVGLMMLAAWSFFGGTDLKTLAAPRIWLVTAANTAAILCFIAFGAVDWRAASLVGAGAVAGGWGGAQLGRQLDPSVVRVATIMIAATITGLFFIHTYLRGFS